MARNLDILLAEDYEADAHLLQLQFRRHRIVNPVHIVPDGAAALDFLFAQGGYAARAGQPLPAVVILDIRLPKLDGWQVLRNLRQEPRTKDLPVVLVTGSVFEKVIAEAAELGANACLAKPLAIPALREALQKCGVELVTVSDKFKV